MERTLVRYQEGFRIHCRLGLEMGQLVFSLNRGLSFADQWLKGHFGEGCDWDLGISVVAWTRDLTPVILWIIPHPLASQPWPGMERRSYAPLLRMPGTGQCPSGSQQCEIHPENTKGQPGSRVPSAPAGLPPPFHICRALRSLCAFSPPGPSFLEASLYRSPLLPFSFSHACVWQMRAGQCLWRPEFLLSSLPYKPCSHIPEHQGPHLWLDKLKSCVFPRWHLSPLLRPPPSFIFPLFLSQTFTYQVPTM